MAMKLMDFFYSDDQGDCDIVHDDDSIMTAIIIIIKINIKLMTS